MRVLTFLAFFLVGIWFVGLVIRSTFSRILRKNAEAYNRAAQAAQKEAQRQARSRREGDVTVEATRGGTEKRVSGNVGEYVEFEEIKNSD